MRKYSLVIVENDEDEQAFIAAAFTKSEQFTLLALCPNGNSLVEWLADNQEQLPDLILSDLNMHGMNGYDIISFIKEHKQYSHIPVVIMSTSSTPSIIEKCFELGAATYITKPQLFIEYDEFIKQLHEKVTNTLKLK